MHLVQLPQFTDEAAKAQESQEIWPSNYRNGLFSDIRTDVKHFEDFSAS